MQHHRNNPDSEENAAMTRDNERAIFAAKMQSTVFLSDEGKTIERYATAARVIHIHLSEFCDEELSYDEMIADAARKAAATITGLRMDKERLLKIIKDQRDELKNAKRDRV